MVRQFVMAACVMLGAGGLQAEMPEPYRSIVDLPFDSHGWFANAQQLSQLIQEVQPQIVVEVGSWLGCSTRHIAGQLPPGGKLYAVDTWAGSSEHSIMPDAKPRLPTLYQTFLSNTKQAGLTEVIVPMRMASLEAAQALNVQADLIYIDGAHDTESVYADIIAWYPHLAEGGVLCGDDWTWSTVILAVQMAARDLNLQIIANGNFWQLR